MGRIVYFLYSNGGIAGGHKMVVRHVEALRSLGFDAVLFTGVDNVLPTWFEHDAPVIVGGDISPDDVLVMADDLPRPLNVAVRRNQRTVLFSQGHTTATADTLQIVDRFPRTPPYIVVGPMLARLVKRLYPQAEVGIVPCFADERIFRPGERQRRLTLVQRKRPDEAKLIHSFYRRFNPGSDLV